ncbi:hypothetical protein SLA2020_099910 [Shorea laevis]
MASTFRPLFLFLPLLPLSATANLHKSKTLLISSLLFSTTTSHLNDTPPTTYFEVTKPIRFPKTQPCAYPILHHDFGCTNGKPPVLANYTPPYGVELLRSCTAEPRATGIVWSAKKDITRFYSLLVKNETQSLAVYLGNLVDRTYTGVYHVDITVYYYPAEKKFNDFESNLENLASGYGSRADLILPISRNFPLNDGLWFEIENSTDAEGKETKIPPNVFRAVLEVYVSFHESDEFCYGNPHQMSNDYLLANNLSDTAGNGPFGFQGFKWNFLDKSKQMANQEIHFDDSVQVKKAYTFSKAKKSCKRFLINLYSNNMDQGNRTYLSIANVTLGFNEKKVGVRGAGYKMPVRSHENLQNGQGIMVVQNNLVVSGVGSTQQKYKYEDNKFCYFRNISSSNYTILNDEVGNACNRSTGSSFGFGFSS